MKIFNFITLVVVSATVCGVFADVDVLPKEIGGVEVHPHSIPFIVNLVYTSGTEENVTFCSGSLLNEHWILTALHCLELYPEIHVVAGHHSMEALDSTTQIRKAFALYQHKPLLSDETGCIGLIYVEDGFNFTKEVQPVTLGELSSSLKDKVTLQGWAGSISSKVRIYPEILRSTNLTVVPSKHCKPTYPKEFNEKSKFCASGPERVACVEQPGGPVLQNGIQVGVVPWRNENCNSANVMSIFLKVSACKTWIQEHILQSPTLQVVDDSNNAEPGFRVNDLVQVNLSLA